MENPMKTILLTAVGMLTILLPAAAAPDFHAILTTIDEQTNFKNTDASALVTIRSKKPGEEDNLMQAQYYRRDVVDQFTIVILKPEANKGQGYLKIEDNIIFYDPESRKFSKLTGSGNFQDSNAKNSDFQASSLANDYAIVNEGDAAPHQVKLGAKDAWVLTLKAVKNSVTYPKQVVWIEVSTNLLLKAEDYSLSDRKMRTSYYGNYINIGGKFLAMRMRFEDNLKVGEVTDLILENPSLAKLPDEVFTKVYLEKVNN
jgi:hypothetical protein